MIPIQNEVTQLLEENRKLSYMADKYKRNIRNNSSENVLKEIAREIEITKSRIIHLYNYIQRVR